MEVELGAEPVIGLRIFAVDFKRLALRSIASPGMLWEPGQDIRSQCKVAPAHHDLKPAENCSCGIWSCKSRRDLGKTFHQFLPQAYKHWDCPFTPILIPVRQPWFVSAQIYQWGTVIEHELGYRSEYAQIIGETLQVWPRQHTRQRKLIAHLREKYSHVHLA